MPQEFLILEHLTRIYGYILMTFFSIHLIFESKLLLFVYINKPGALVHSSGVGTVRIYLLCSLLYFCFSLTCQWWKLVCLALCSCIHNSYKANFCVGLCGVCAGQGCVEAVVSSKKRSSSCSSRLNISPTSGTAYSRETLKKRS